MWEATTGWAMARISRRRLLLGGGAAAFTARIATASRHRDGWSGELGQLELRLGDRGVPRGPRGVFHQPGEELVEQWGETAVAFSRDAADDRQLLGGSRVTSPFPADVTYRRCAERPRSVLPMWWPAVPMVVVPVAGWVDAFVKPDGAWLAVVVSAEPFAHMRAGRLARRGAVALVPTGPETQLLHPAGASAEAVAAFGASLSPSFVVTHVGEAKAERATSVVYAAEGWEEAALALTAEVPGGAVVEPLTWSVPTACLVVALGSSAEAAWAN